MCAEIRGRAVCLVLRGKHGVMGKRLLWEVEGWFAVVPQPSAPSPTCPAVGLLRFLFPASVALGKTYKNLEVQQ